MAGSRALTLVWLALCLASVAAEKAAERANFKGEVTPTQKVLQMLNEMNSKGKKAKHEEEVEFAKFHEWCDNVKFERTKSIKEGKALIEQLTADIAKAEADAEQLTADIEELRAAITKAEKELKAATEVRDKEHADYVAVHTDQTESIDALARAIQVLKAKDVDVPQSLVQLQNSPLIPLQAKAVIASFLSVHAQGMSFTQLGVGAPEANAYEFQSGGVISMMEKLKLKFEDEKLQTEKEEMNSKHNYNMLAQALTDNIKADKDTEKEKTAAKAKALDDAATAKGDKKVAQETLAEDQKVLSDTTSECIVKAQEYEKNQVTRMEEIKAITKATEILNSAAVKGNADEHLPTMVQTSEDSTSFAQLRSSAEFPNSVRHRVVEFLQGRAKQLNSRYLSLVAARSAEDPFAKVKKMIKDMIVKLMEEANAEADQKGYCDTELATNKQTRENKASEVEELTALSEELTAKSAQLSEEISALAEGIADITKQQKEATDIRQEEKATNAKTVADSKEAQTAVELATKVLKDFYNKADSSSLIQSQSSDDQAEGETLGQQMSQATKEPYTGMASGGVMAMLEVILSDFARLEAETSAAEDAAAAAYEKMMAETTESIAVKETEKEHKEKNRDLADEKNASTKKELELTKEELDAALTYYSKLKEECIDTGLSYEERVRAREEEIQSLQEALKILNQQDLA